MKNLSNYPPGVTGNEPQITGEDPRPRTARYRSGMARYRVVKGESFFYVVDTHVDEDFEGHILHAFTLRYLADDKCSEINKKDAIENPKPVKLAHNSGIQDKKIAVLNDIFEGSAYGPDSQMRVRLTKIMARNLSYEAIRNLQTILNMK